MKKIILLFIVLFSVFYSPCNAETQGQLVFVRDGDIWIAGINGSNENRFTYSGNNRNPAISPDGKTVVFSIEYDKNTGFGKLATMTSTC